MLTRKDGRIAPRSGLAAKHSIDVGAGVIDADYRGPLKTLLFNLGDADFTIKQGDRIAQLVLERASGCDPLWTHKLTMHARLSLPRWSWLTSWKKACEGLVALEVLVALLALYEWAKSREWRSLHLRYQVSQATSTLSKKAC